MLLNLPSRKLGEQQSTAPCLPHRVKDIPQPHRTYTRAVCELQLSHIPVLKGKIEAMNGHLQYSAAEPCLVFWLQQKATWLQASWTGAML